MASRDDKKRAHRLFHTIVIASALAFEGGCASSHPLEASTEPDAVLVTDAGGVTDAVARDSGIRETGTSDVGLSDAGLADAGLADAGLRDVGPHDAVLREAGMSDAALGDAISSDAGSGDIDVIAPDASTEDATDPRMCEDGWPSTKGTICTTLSMGEGWIEQECCGTIFDVDPARYACCVRVRTW